MKKLFNYIAIAALAISMISCNNSKKSDSATATADSIQITDMHNAENALDFYGEYEGTIPAADCPGIDVALMLEKDKTFTRKMVYQERENSDFEDIGIFTIDGNVLTLTSKDGNETYYKVEEGRVVMLDINKQPIEGAMKDMYVLTQKKVF